MDVSQCPACGQGVQGILVSFPDRDVQEQIQDAMPRDFRSRWQTTAELHTWFELRLAYDSLPYWEEHHDVAKWKLRWANRLPDGRVECEEVVSWQTLSTSVPSLFVEEIIRDHRIRMMKQPIVDVSVERVIGHEMLVRGLDTDGSVISPLDLYRGAREQNQLFRLDRACRIAAIEEGGALPPGQLVFVNFIPTSIYVPEHCLATTLAAVERVGIDRRRIVFEVVETDRVEDLKHLQRILAFYRNTGFRCALDDFGEGFNDVHMLKALEPDIVKLDRKYVSGIDTDTRKQDIAAYIYEQGAAVGSTMLAEGIETEAEARTLWQIGYHWQQGYWYGRPGWEASDVPTERIRAASRPTTV